jgi:hypothetical protein
MTREDIVHTIDHLDRALRSCAGTRDPQESVQLLRRATDQAKRALNNLTPDRWDVELRQLARQLTAQIELAEGSLRTMTKNPRQGGGG